jgi:hypothetical protein
MPGRKRVRKKTSGVGRRPACPVCGRRTDLAGVPCAACAERPGAATLRRVAEGIRDRLQGDEEREGFICPVCRGALTWHTLGSSETEVTIYVREKIYFCPHCRALLGVSSWHTEG